MGALDGNQTNGKGSSFDAGGISTLGPVNGLTLEAGNGQDNQVVLEGAPAGSPVQMVAQGSDVNIPITLSPKGNGKVVTSAQFNPGAVVTGGPIVGGKTVGSLTTVGNATLTAALLLGQIISRGGAQTAAFTDTTDTAADIIAAFGYLVGSVVVRIINTTADVQTIAGGTGVTISGTATLAAGTFRDFLMTMDVGANTVTLTNIGSGTD
ncbi:MAG: hypothetical protein ACYCR5_04545 [Leptospirillum sp.]